MPDTRNNLTPQDAAPADVVSQAMEISTQAAMLGFDWAEPRDVLDKLDEELDEVRRALDQKTREDVTEEIGDLFFALVNFCRKMQIDPGRAFGNGVRKFERRFRSLSARMAEKGGEMSAQVLDDLWQQVKMGERHEQ